MTPDHAWNQGYRRAVVEYQMLVQHHVHPISKDDDDVRVCLPSCLKKDSKQCRSRYPRVKEMSATCVIGCAAVCKSMELNTSGRRCMLGSLLGPRNNVWLNGTHPALLYNLKCNSDTILTYRIPVLQQTHSAACPDKDCLEKSKQQNVLYALLRSQRDQAGYITDYVSKRNPIAIKEIQKFVKGMPLALFDLYDNYDAYSHA